MKQLETFNTKNQAIAFSIRKKHKITLEDLMGEIKKIKSRLDKIEDRLDRNNIN